MTIQQYLNQLYSTLPAGTDINTVEFPSFVVALQQLAAEHPNTDITTVSFAGYTLQEIADGAVASDDPFNTLQIIMENIQHEIDQALANALNPIRDWLIEQIEGIRIQLTVWRHDFTKWLNDWLQSTLGFWTSIIAVVWLISASIIIVATGQACTLSM